MADNKHLLVEIEKMRNILNEMMLSNNGVINYEILELSHKLDDLLTRYQLSCVAEPTQYGLMKRERVS